MTYRRILFALAVGAAIVVGGTKPDALFAPRILSLVSAPSGSAAVTNLQFSSFELSPSNTFVFGAEWPADAYFPDGGISVWMTDSIDRPSNPSTIQPFNLSTVQSRWRKFPQTVPVVAGTTGMTFEMPRPLQLGGVLARFFRLTGDNYPTPSPPGDGGEIVGEPPRDWRTRYGLDPFRAIGGEDPDGDGKSNYEEYCEGTDPMDEHSCGCVLKPTDTISLTVSIGSDAAAWELEIKGNGPDDFDICRLVMPKDLVWLTNTYEFCKGNSYTLTLHWINNDRLKNAGNAKCPWHCWEARVDGKPNVRTRENWTLERIPDVEELIVGEGYIIDNRDGLLTDHVHKNSTNGVCEVHKDISATIYVLGDPKLTPDYNGDGCIDQEDEAILESGRTFRFWVNDDKDDASSDGDVARNSKIFDDGNDDIPASGSDGTDDEVNGRRDLVDFTPIRVDVLTAIGHLPTNIQAMISFRLRQDDEAVNVVWSNLSPSDANSFQTVGYASGFGAEFDSVPQEAASVQVVSGGLPLVSKFEELVKIGSGILLVEGRCASTNPLVVEAVCKNCVVCSNELRMSVSSVEDMYRWLGLRSVCGDQDLAGRSTVEPANLPDDETTGPHYVFVHGYNVNVQSARGWAAEMFKRLWQAGARSKFTAVDWYGDESQFWAGVPFVGGESLNYYVNVRHALDAAQHLQAMLSGLPGEKVMMAHSLGNMLVSEAAVRYGLVYSKYYMLNAAVPMEAYDDSASNFEMIEHGWRDVPLDKWASHWYECIPYENDPRRTLKWKGYFAGIRNAVNCYSPTEDVLANATTNWYGGEWSIQELYKGTAALHFIPGNCEGGWGYNDDHTNLAGFLTDFAKTNDFTEAELVASPIFRRFDNDVLHQTNRITIAQTELNKVLGDGIPALSFAAGRNEISRFGDGGNYNYQGVGIIPNGWPRTNGDWRHSDLKNVAYFYVWKLFEKIRKVE